MVLVSQGGFSIFSENPLLIVILPVDRILACNTLHSLYKITI